MGASPQCARDGPLEGFVTLREVFLAYCKLSLHLSLIVSINSAASGLGSERARSVRQGTSCSYDSLTATAIYYSWTERRVET